MHEIERCPRCGSRAVRTELRLSDDGTGTSRYGCYACGALGPVVQPEPVPMVWLVLGVNSDGRSSVISAHTSVAGRDRGIEEARAKMDRGSLFFYYMVLYEAVPLTD